jgi:hypothetical protein
VTEPYEGSPHGYAGAGRLVPGAHGASGDPTSSVSERSLFHAYRVSSSARRVERCACGGDIEAEDDYRAIADAVDLHNASTVHQQWRAWRDELR